MHRVSVIIPNWNGASLLAQAIVSVQRQTYQVHEVIVADNGSTDDSRGVAARAGARFVPLGANYGFSRAVNEGIRLAHGDWIAILNNDVELAADWLATLLERADARGCAFATGKILSARQPDYIDGTFDAICRGGCAWRCGQMRPDGPLWNTERGIRLAPLTAALFQSRVFRTVGLLDDLFESYLEDIEFGIRCSTNGFAGVYVPSAVAWHQGSATLGAWNPETVRRIARNQLYLLARHVSGGALLKIVWPAVVAQLLWGGVALRHGAGGAFLRGKLEGLKQFSRIRSQSQPRPGTTALLYESELELRDLQRRSGFDLYWKLYFALT